MAFTDRFLKQPFEVSKYTETIGLLPLREALAGDLKHYGGINVSPDQLVITDGALEGLSLTLSCLTEPGDSVLLMEPCYSVYWDLLRFLGLKVVALSQKLEDGFQPNPERIKEALSKGVAAALLCSPDNPTSRIVSKEAAKTLSDGVIDRDIPLLYDEAYKHILYEGKHLWIGGTDGLGDNFVSLNSFSKDLAIPGFRLGYMYGPKSFVEQAVKLKALTSICSSTPSQYLALAYLENDRKGPYLQKVLPVYRQRRDALHRSLTSALPEARVMKPEAGMYLFPDLSAYLDKLHMDDVDFCLRMAEEAGVIAIPGSISGPSGKGHLRMCFVGETEERLEAGVAKMAEYISKH
jgi:aspartate aminotransferase